MIDEKIARVKALIQKREEIDAELSSIFAGAAPSKRGRPRKQPADDGGGHGDASAATVSTIPGSAEDR